MKMPVMSVRLSDKEIKLIQALAQEEEKEKSSEARELMLDGIKYKMLLGYKQGKVSLGTSRAFYPKGRKRILL